MPTEWYVIGHLPFILLLINLGTVVGSYQPKKATPSFFSTGIDPKD